MILLLYNLDRESSVTLCLLSSISHIFIPFRHQSVLHIYLIFIIITGLFGIRRTVSKDHGNAHGTSDRILSPSRASSTILSKLFADDDDSSDDDREMNSVPSTSTDRSKLIDYKDNANGKVK